MPLNMKCQVETHSTQVTIELDKYPEDGVVAYLGFEDKECGQDEYALHIEPEDLEVLNELVDETFAHMRSHLQKNRDPDSDDDEENEFYR